MLFSQVSFANVTPIQTLLDIADSFVDDVTMAACRLAKVRSDNEVRLRDFQTILERQYNIRVPGYGSDEMRTVKKGNPTAGWAQKMNAVNAAKVTGSGKGT